MVQGIGNAQQIKNSWLPRSNPSQLKMLACIAVVHQYVRSCGRGFMNCILWPRVEKSYPITGAYLPETIQDMIGYCYIELRTRASGWLSFNRPLFDEIDRGFKLVDLLSWDTSGDGTIDYCQTARNLIMSDEVSAKEKYRVACIYCFVEDIERLVSGKHDHWHPMIKYWNCRMEGKLYGLTNVYKEGRTVEFDLLCDMKADGLITFSALEYLWGFLTDDEQVELTTYRHGCHHYFLEHLLCKLKKEQLESVIESRAAEVFKTLYIKSETLALCFWNHIKNMISVASFSKMLVMLMQQVPKKITFEIWFSASDDLKKNVLSRYLDELLDSMFKIWQCYDDGRLLMEVLSKNPSTQNEILWRDHWKNIINDLPLGHLQTIMKMCLGSGNEVASFKKNYFCKYSEIEFYLNDLVDLGSFKKLNEFLTYVTNDPDVIFDLKFRILKSPFFLDEYMSKWKNRPHRFPHVFDEINELDKFVNETFHDADQLYKFKKYLIMSEKSMKTFFRWLSGGGKYEFIEELCHHFLFSMPDVLTEVKTRLLEVARNVLSSAVFKRFSSTAWEKFVKWCLNSDDYSSMKRFKDSLPVDTIFNKLIEEGTLELKLSVESQQLTDSEPEDEFEAYEEPADPHDTYLNNLQCFLCWYFDDNNQLQHFKLSKLNDDKNINKEVKSLLESNNRPAIDLLLEWFNSEDELKSI